jgi:hypothetical protein
MSKLLSNELQPVTQEHLNLEWGGNKNNFRCGFCGHKFQLGDQYCWVYTNDIPECGGNPLCCEKCAEIGTEGLRLAWKKKYDVAKNEMWWFTRHRH